MHDSRQVRFPSFYWSYVEYTGDQLAKQTWPKGIRQRQKTESKTLVRLSLGEMLESKGWTDTEDREHAGYLHGDNEAGGTHQLWLWLCGQSHRGKTHWAGRDLKWEERKLKQETELKEEKNKSMKADEQWWFYTGAYRGLRTCKNVPKVPPPPELTE